MLKSRPFSLGPHERIPEETVTLIAKHPPKEAANLLFLTNGDLIVVLDCEFNESELNNLPEFICGRKIHFTSKVGIRPIQHQHTRAGIGHQKNQSTYCPGRGNSLERTILQSKTPFSKAEGPQPKTSAAGVVVQIPNGDR